MRAQLAAVGPPEHDLDWTILCCSEVASSVRYHILFPEPLENSSDLGLPQGSAAWLSALPWLLLAQSPGPEWQCEPTAGMVV